MSLTILQTVCDLQVQTMKFSQSQVALFFVVYIVLSCRHYTVGNLNCDVSDKSGLPGDVCTFDLRMKGAQPKKVSSDWLLHLRQ